MLILVLNSGSSSIKYKWFNAKDLKIVFDGIEEEVKDFHKSFENIFDKLIKSKVINKLEDIDAFGHRIVHGGERFSKPVLVDEKVLKELEKLTILAPLHNPSNIDGIKIIKNKLPNTKQIAVFDTAFHQTMPKKTFLYPLPINLYKKHKIRKYGFHGTSHHFVAKQYASSINKKLKNLNIITIHLGNGASMCAIKNGKSIDTTMGFTPLEGLMMGTRCGDIDPAIILYLQKHLKLSILEVDNLLNKQSGFKGICNESDFRKVKSKLAIKIYVEKIRKYLGSYILKLPKLDAIIFTGGIGENSAILRSEVCKNLYDNLSIKLSNSKNKKLKFKAIQEISSEKSKVKICVIKTNEEKEIASITKDMIASI